MSRQVVFNALWLLSERDAQARYLTFASGRNLIAGGNDTGKSRILKHLVWALGCEPPRRASGEFDSNVVVALDLTVSGKQLTFLRQNRKQAAFDASKSLVFATQSASEWNAFFAGVFDFELQLQRTEEGKFDHAGPSSAFLPSYIDQDSGWGTKWNGFTNLGQFVKWQPTLFNWYTGMKPPAWIRNQHKSELAALRLKTAKTHAKLQESSYERVAAMLPSESTAIDEAQFAQELQVLAKQAQTLQDQQNSVRADLLELALERQQISVDFNVALASERELVEDQAFLAGYKDGETLTCPTCSHVHTTTFLARHALADDAHDIHQVVIRLQGKLEKCNAKEAALQVSLLKVVAQLKSLNETLSIKRDGQSLADIVAAKSHLTLRNAYDLTRRDLNVEIDSLAEERKEADDELAALTDKGREKRIRDFFAAEATSFADKLGINKVEIGKVKIGSRSPSSSGSNAPRAVLAMHLALISTHKMHGAGPTFPFIVDTPQQSGQDPDSLGRMLTTILEGTTGQSIVASETVPQGWRAPGNCKIQVFEEKRQLLKEGEFKEGVQVLAPLVQAMMAGLGTDTLLHEDDPEPANGPVPDDDEDGNES